MEDLAIRHYIERVATMNDTAAFKKIFSFYYAKLKRFSYGIVKDKELAEELASDVFINVWRNRARLLEIENFDAYIYISIRNLSIQKITRNKEYNFFDIDKVNIPIANSQITPEEILLNKEIVRQIETAIMELPPRCRTIYQLARQDGLKYKQIAIILNISVKTVDAQMAIAVKRISDFLKYRFKTS